MNDIFFISDTHWYHNNIIRLCERPFESIAEMNEVLVNNWNNIVRPGDIVYHVGDFINPRGTRANKFLDRLNGTVFLAQGNHDSKKALYRFPQWAPRYYLNVGDYKFLLQHYPEYPDGLKDQYTEDRRLFVDKRDYEVDFILSGHIHNNHFDRNDKKVGRLWTGRSLNLSVEVHNYCPIPLDTVIFYCDKRKEQMNSKGYKLVVPADNPDEQLEK